MVKVTVSRPAISSSTEIQLRLALPRDADAEPLMVLLCQEENREEMARRFYRLKSFEAIDATYERLKEARESQKSNRRRAGARLRQERNQARQVADRAGRNSARLKPEETSRMYPGSDAGCSWRARSQKPVQALDAEKLKRSVDAARRKKAEAEKALAEAIERVTCSRPGC